MSALRFNFLQSVLFIDDQTKFENLIRGGLLTFPAQYEFCPSRVSTVLERLQGEVPDLIVSTLEFTDGSALDLIRKSNGFLEKVPSIYLSEPHLADVEAEMALAGRFNVMERKSGPLDLIRKMAQVIAENIDLEKPVYFAPKAEEPELLSPWAEAILKKNK